MAAPVASGDEIELRIDSLAYGGNGVARVDGYVVFVRRGLPGDLVRARIGKVRKSHAEGWVVDVLEPSAERVEAPCDHFPACGGCRFQDYAYEAQLSAKEAQVRDALVRLGGIADPPLEPAVPAESHFHYRNKLEYSFAPGPAGAVLGFHRAGRWDEVLDIRECWLTTELGNGLREAVRLWAREHELPAYDQRSQDGFLRHLVVREGRNTGQALVVLVTAPGSLEEDSFVRVVTRFPEVRSVSWGINDRPAEVTNVPTRLLWGEDAIEEELCGLRFRVRPNAFLQTNTAMAERVYALARSSPGFKGTETVYDLYCGTGTIGLVARAEGAHRVGRRGIGGGGGVRDRERRAERDHELGLLRRRGRTLARRAPRKSRPARCRRRRPSSRRPVRQGCAGDRRLAPSRLVYVSCNPTTLAGNAKELAASWGYRLETARPVDMFPHTPHVETVALFSRA